MNGRRTLALALLACAAAAPGASAKRDPAAELAEALRGRAPGTPQRCILLPRDAGPRIVGETLLYREGRRLWRSDARGRCPSLAGDPIIIVESYGGQLCADDRFRTLPRGSPIPGPYCRFGPFTPYVRPRP